ncbi:uncharacterized protein LOC111619706, partial [Centruroides sculpturatus]|uniref:uncharacterized protein LOC111619706 n=1 Tax=Centruroides sculpturatus TaxID=218467 RepID=UPI000C6E4C6D
MKRLSHNVYTLESQKQVEAENEENEGREEKDKDQKNAVEVLHHHAGVKSNRKEKYQVRVKIIEGRQLSGANINPVCKVSLHGVSKQTRVVKSSVNPWWDEIFFFHLETSPADLYSETIDFHVNNARAFRSNTLLGSFKLDLGIIYEQPEHVFLNKWLLLGSTDDTVSRAMGYLKFSAVVLGPGDECPNLATPEHKEDDDVESNLLLASGVQLKPASFIIDVYQAIDLPQMDSSMTDGVKKMLHVERKKDLVDPYLAVVFAGHKVQSTIIHGKDHPEWNERIFLDFQFPSMCEKIKLVLTDWDRLTEDDIIATYLMSINHISAPGEYGYLPTYGPSWVNFYGSPREYTDLNNGCDGLNKGIGEGCSYRGRALLSLRTNLGSFSEVKSVPVEKTELLQVMPYCRRRKYRLHAAFIDASMVSVIDTPVEFEVSIVAGIIINGGITFWMEFFLKQEIIMLEFLKPIVRVKIIEGRQLSGANINPVCKVSLHGVSKQTRVVKSSVNPWWDEIFFFHLETSPADLYSETIDFHVNNARAFRSNTLLGSFKLDLGIIYEQPEHVFLNKWLLLGSTDDTVSRAMGYLKFSAVVLGPGDECPNLATPEHKEDDDVESNLLLASGVQLKPASFIIDVYQAIDLPQMDSSMTDGVKKMLHVERKKDLVDPYLAVVFAGHKVQSTIIHGKDHPEWNERIFLDFQFPSMCEKIKLVLTDWDRLTEDDIIATYLMSINHISAPGEYGYLPTYGPSWVNFYGSPREYTDLNNGCDGLNKGIGEGCSYRGRALLSLRTNLGSFSEVKSVPVEKTELLQVMPYCRRRKYRLHAAFIDASMVSVIDTPVEFEVSI